MLQDFLEYKHMEYHINQMRLCMKLFYESYKQSMSLKIKSRIRNGNMLDEMRVFNIRIGNSLICKLGQSRIFVNNSY